MTLNKNLSSIKKQLSFYFKEELPLIFYEIYSLMNKSNYNTPKRIIELYNERYGKKKKMNQLKIAINKMASLGILAKIEIREERNSLIFGYKISSYI